MELEALKSDYANADILILQDPLRVDGLNKLSFLGLWCRYLYENNPTCKVVIVGNKVNNALPDNRISIDSTIEEIQACIENTAAIQDIQPNSSLFDVTGLRGFFKKVMYGHNRDSAYQKALEGAMATENISHFLERESLRNGTTLLGEPEYMNGILKRNISYIREIWETYGFVFNYTPFVGLARKIEERMILEETEVDSLSQVRMVSNFFKDIIKLFNEIRELLNNENYE